MKKRTRILNVLVAVAIVLQPVVCFGEPVSTSKMQKRNDVYYYKDKPYTGEFTESDGEGSSTGNMKNGKRHGEVKSSDIAGIWVANYKDGKLDGEVKNFESNLENGGEKYLSYVGNYKDDKKHGEWKYFDENGNLIKVENYKDGKLDGEVKTAPKTTVQPGSKATVQLSSFRDQRDGKTYKTVKIGKQTWMAENLNYDTKDSKCYENKPINCEKYGRLYNWATAKKVCPSGWRLPSESEWEALDKAAGGENVSGKKLKAKSNWNENGNGTDEFGFSALPGGGFFSNGNFGSVGYLGLWWSSSKGGGDSVYLLRSINYSDDYASWDGSIGSGLFSVRCIQDNGNLSEPDKAVDLQPNKSVTTAQEEVKTVRKATVQLGSFRDQRDGRTYKTVKIGKQTWMAENLNYDTKDSKCYENKPINCEKYGRLYNWATAKKVCPSGWHLPSKNEWEALDKAVGGENVSGKKLKADSGWNLGDKSDGNGTDEFGFSALPSGGGLLDGSFGGVGNYGSLWSASEHNGKTFFRNSENASWLIPVKINLFSVRCLQD